MAEYDLAIIGGGINGTGLARDAAGRGLRVLLVEMNDLASGSSSASSKMIHGGLRHLEHGAIRWVREALAEREVLLRVAPHLVQPLRLLLPVALHGSSPLVLRCGLLLYDLLGARRLLPRSRVVDLTHHPWAGLLKRSLRLGFEFSDCWVDDSRLVVLNALDAAERGAVIRTRTRLVRAERGEAWTLILNRRGRREQTSARILVNATGPWIGAVAETAIRVPLARPARLVKGSHIVVRRRLERDRGFLLQARDGHVVFMVPLAEDFTLIGPTDRVFVGDLAAPAPSFEEICYLCETVNDYFRDKVTPDEVIWSFAGVRALYDDGAGKPEGITRGDHVVALDAPASSAPLLTIYGGRITTYRRLAEVAMTRIAPFVAARAPWTATGALPGGNFAPDRLAEQVAEAMQRWPFLSESHATRLVHAYGSRVERILGDARRIDDLGVRFTSDLTAAEVRYLVDQEWAETAEDVLWRRSKLGLTATEAEVAALAQFLSGLRAEKVARR